MARPTIFGKALSQTERNRRYRQKLRGNLVEQPEPDAEALLKLARHEIWGLQRLIGQMRRDARDAAQRDHHITGPMGMEIKRLKGLLAKHGIEP
jgi:hypothetical protein